MATLEIRPLSGTIGAEVRGCDVSLMPSPELAGEIRRALLQYKVLLFRGQPALSMARQIAFAQAFGEIETEFPSFAPKLAENPEITLFDSRNGSGRAEMWHTDLTVSETPTAFGVLCVKERPARGGDTMWADSEAAYASLSPGMRAFLEGQRAVHDMYSPEYAARPGGNKRTDLDMSRISRAEHPLVRVHPETGRKCLFVNPFFTSHIVGFSSEESANILNFLYARMERPEFIVRWHWSEGDVAMWDNRCTTHVAVNDYGDAHRLAQRVCVKGDAPFGVGEARRAALETA
ncbi:TauD/TfdA dioxygenase family protein [Chromobacterium subtsugae]|uniref:TauD/TfdA dioxygenase family protein n=1 Tax=Chromobacterium subtsugae TaxID=251747 RepID=UPI000641263C|nr:TauD/TfdA family dioxygenase [Chromobacterium subtsugae]